MHRQRRQFPLIPDGEPCLQEPVSMRLYENEDLITNIRGPYQDKDYNDLLPNYDFLSAKPSNRKQAPKRVETQEAGMTYAEEARERLSVMYVRNAKNSSAKKFNKPNILIAVN